MTPDERLTKTIALLESIDRSLKVLVQQRASVTLPGAAATTAIAPDSDLDSPKGDEVVKFKPRDWTGADYVNLPMSQCPAIFLDMLAESFEYFATKNEQAGALTTSGKPKAVFDRRSAARARGWARRLRQTPRLPTATTDDSPPWEGSEWPGEGF